MTTEKKFIDGMRYSAPSEKAPAWVKGHISVQVDPFIRFATGNCDERGWLNIDVKESKAGNLYLELSTYRPGSAKPKSTPEDEAVEALDIPEGGDLPF